MFNNILIDELPTSVEIGGKSVAVNFGFRALVLIELCMFDTSRNKEQQTLDALNLFYFQNIPEPRDEAIEKLLWFYRCGEEPKVEKNETAKKASKAVRCYDFDQDARYIYAAYLTQYRIDLQDIRSNDLHWWKFKAMFESLEESHKISKIMQYRTMDLHGMKGKELAFYKKMKGLYAIQDEATADSKIALAQRDKRILDYVHKRFEGVQHEEKS